MYKHILVPTDGSPLSQDAARSAVRFAKAIGAQITVFYAMPNSIVNYYAEGIAMNTSLMEEATRLSEKQAHEYLEFVMNLCRESGVSCAKKTRTSNFPHEAIIETALQSDCDLIFMASHGRKGISGLLLGSETAKVLAHSKIPVLVFR